jgi:hypothetical protein
MEDLYLDGHNSRKRGVKDAAPRGAVDAAGWKLIKKMRRSLDSETSEQLGRLRTDAVQGRQIHEKGKQLRRSGHGLLVVGALEGLVQTDVLR